jgi:aryl-alcohol dehydrogenase-like predicted oxidoreductase
MTFGEGWGLGGVTQDEATTMVEKCLAAGVNFFDTADVYSKGVSETMLGVALQKLEASRSELVIATKVRGRMSDTDVNACGLSRHHIMNSIEGSLERLQTDYVDLYQVHGWDFHTPLEETLDALNDVVRSGMARYIGISNYAGWQIAKAVTIQRERGYAPFVSLQMFYAVVCRDLEYEVAPAAEDMGLGILPWSPLAGGFVTGKYPRGEKEHAPGTRWADSLFGEFPLFDRERGYDILDVLKPIAEAKGVSMAQAGIAWLLTRPTVSSVIIGARRLPQLDDNLASVAVEFTQDELTALDDASRPLPRYPQWMISRLADKMKG